MVQKNDSWCYILAFWTITGPKSRILEKRGKMQKNWALQEKGGNFCSNSTVEFEQKLTISTWF